MASTTPEQWAERQFVLDIERTRRFPQLLEHKLARMSESPFAFLRGAEPLFYEVLEERPELTTGPAGEGWIAGDLHLENFGVFRSTRVKGKPGKLEGKRTTSFDLNDFDDALCGPWRLDIVRLLASLILAGRELGVSGPEVLQLAAGLLESYVDTAFRKLPPPSPPPPVERLIERVQSRSQAELLDDRTLSVGGHRHFERGKRYADLPPEILSELPQALEVYANDLREDERVRSEQLTVVDAAHRIAGTGSLGLLRVAVLTRGKGGLDGGWMLDLKEQTVASGARLVEASSLPPAEHALSAMRACIDPPPQRLGSTNIGATPLVVRAFTPQKDKLRLAKLKKQSLPSLARYLGALTGAAHARAAAHAVTAPWSARECSDLLHNAVTIAALHEAVYLEWCMLLRSRAALGTQVLNNS